jgi:hypothetical protein
MYSKIVAREFNCSSSYFCSGWSSIRGGLYNNNDKECNYGIVNYGNEKGFIVITMIKKAKTVFANNGGKITHI